MASVDVGDAVQIVYATTTGATVRVTWSDPNSVIVLDAVAVTESPVGSGNFPYTFLPTSAGVWEARFVASGTATAVERYWVRATSITDPPPLATIGEVTDLFGTLSTAQQGLVTVLLRRASAMVRTRWPDLATRIAAGELSADTVAHAVVNMVLRVLRNPAGMRSETVGPFTRTFDTRISAGLLEITDAEVAMLAPVVATALPGKARTIRVSGGFMPPVTYATRYGIASSTTVLTDETLL